ncbi:MAG: rod shape-determining protein RodA, partial [Novosphingobium sp.]
MTRRIVPEAIAREPWGLLLPLLALNTFGATVLYSAAGGNLWPWSLLHEVRFFVFMAMAFVISRIPRGLFKQAAYPLYGTILVMLFVVEAMGKVS